MSDAPGPPALRAAELVLAVVLCLMGGLLLHQQFALMAAQKHLLRASGSTGSAGTDRPAAAELREAAAALREAAGTLAAGSHAPARAEGADAPLDAALLLSRATGSDIRRSAAAILGTLGQTPALDRLESMVRSDPDDRVRREALSALFGAGAVERTRAHVIRLLEEGTPAQREIAVGLAGELADPRMVEPLLAALEQIAGNNASHRRREIVEVLRRIGDPRAVEPLLGLLAAESEPWARQQILRAVAPLARARHVPALVRHYRRERLFEWIDVQRTFLQAALRLQDLRLTETVLPYLESDNAHIRQLAAQALLRLRDPAAAAALAAIYDELDPRLHAQLAAAFRAGYPGLRYDGTTDTPVLLEGAAMAEALAEREERLKAQVAAAERPLVPGDEPPPRRDPLF
jgi:HEAT repeat protein